jgi:amino acid transporter
MEPLWGFDRFAATAVGATTETIDSFAHVGRQGILSAILATFAIAPWAFVGFETIPQAAEEFKFSYKKVMLIMTIATA